MSKYLKSAEDQALEQIFLELKAATHLCGLKGQLQRHEHWEIFAIVNPAGTCVCRVYSNTIDIVSVHWVI